ncbi:MAG: tetratricopeptide repeat protein [Deltaproteobacteria bacterium]|uniref:Tetratricopeptide repeat protein n=1 Tax=Candidatus Zymogenus saltonus TaxID=2844893 RepID=A0A9D8KCP6_9DELT|nr:tetratricopeptide repeat protein [Candidatus Zymogenus saltonus]
MNIAGKARSGLLLLFIIAAVALPFSVCPDFQSFIGPTVETASAWSAETISYEDYLERTEKLIFADRFKDAVELIEEAINKGGHKTAKLYFYLALSYDNLDELESAVTNYKKAISMNIDKEELLVSLKNLGIILRSQDNHKEAANYFGRYLKLVPDDPDVDNIRSYVEYYKKQ